MQLTQEIKNAIDRSVLCWLATSSREGMPNVSPKEMFTYFGTDEIIIANIASPQTVRNIKFNDKVCVSFIDVLVQKGFQIKGKAQILNKKDKDFPDRAKILNDMTGGLFPFASIIQVFIERAKPIIAPRYILFPETTEADQIASAKKTYGF